MPVEWQFGCAASWSKSWLQWLSGERYTPTPMIGSLLAPFLPLSGGAAMTCQVEPEPQI